MAYDYKKHAMVDGKKYGPTVGGRYYQPADYHGKVKDNNKKGRKAKNKEHENVSTKVVKIIQSYVGIVNKLVWRK